METYDLCVIGGGPAGYAACIRALDFGLKTILIEKDRVGGAGVYHGALSSKTLWELSRDFRKLNIQDRGYHIKSYTTDYREVVSVMNNALEERKWQLEYQLREMESKYCKGNFRFAQGFGSMLNCNEVQITTSTGQEVIHATNIILATGSRPRYLPDIPIDEKIIVTSDGIASFEDFPESLVILGAGVIGCEFATIFANFGKTKVFLIDKANRILPFEDQDIADTVTRNLEAAGVTIHHDASLESMTIDGDRVKYVLRYNNGKIQTYYANKGLVSVGRVTNIDMLGCECVGLELGKRGEFVVDDVRTNVPNIYAVGDLTADINLVNVAELEGRHAVERIVNGEMPSVSYENISTIMFLQPEVAGVGMNEQDLLKANTPYRVASYSYTYVARGIAMRATKGFFKLIVSDDDEMRILGMRVVGEHASSTIQAVALLMHLGKGIKELAEIPHPHPAMPEGVQECARMLLGTSIIKPYVFDDKALHCHRVVDGRCTPM